MSENTRVHYQTVVGYACNVESSLGNQRSNRSSADKIWSELPVLETDRVLINAAVRSY